MTKQATPTMQRALSAMLKATTAPAGVCRNTTPGHGIAHSTMTALVRRGLAERCACPFGGGTEFRLTAKGAGHAAS
jgi:hypothetical protein